MFKMFEIFQNFPGQTGIERVNVPSTKRNSLVTTQRRHEIYGPALGHAGVFIPYQIINDSEL